MLSKSFDIKGGLTLAKGERAVVARISTASVDRDGDVMLPSGIDTSDFVKNPVVLFGHDANAIPIGKAAIIKTNPTNVEAKVIFARRPESLPRQAEWAPDTIFDLFKQGVLRAFSVGFQIEKAREADKKDMERFGSKCRRVISAWKLLEFSVVPIPANQDALVTAISKGIVRRNSWTHKELATEREYASFVFRADTQPKRFSTGSRFYLAGG